MHLDVPQGYFLKMHHQSLQLVCCLTAGDILDVKTGSQARKKVGNSDESCLYPLK